MERAWRLIRLMLRSPIPSVCICYSFTIQVILICIERLLIPKWPRYQSFRLKLQRAWWATCATYAPNLIHLLPADDYPDTRARKVGNSEWTGFIVPGTRQLRNVAKLLQSSSSQQCVIVFVHGGGYARGEARMYLRFMERWQAQARLHGLEVTFLSVEYRKTATTLRCRYVVPVNANDVVWEQLSRIRLVIQLNVILF